MPIDLNTLADAIIKDAVSKRAEKPHPGEQVDYDAQKTKVVTLLDQTFKHAQTPKEGEKRCVVCLGGPNPSKQLLMEAVADKNNTSAAIADIRTALNRSAFFDFATAKETLIPADKIKDPNEYNRWRPLLAAMDRAVAQTARDEKLHLVYDNTLAPNVTELASLAVTPDANAKSHGGVTDRIKLEKQAANGSELRVYAIDISKEYAASAAKIALDKYGIAVNEAEKNAANFQTFLPTLKQMADGVTLLPPKDFGLSAKQQEGKELPPAQQTPGNSLPPKQKER